LLCSQVHPETGIDHCEDRYAAVGQRLGFDTSLNATIPCDMGNLSFAQALFDM
jgi:hypothetical protein